MRVGLVALLLSLFGAVSVLLIGGDRSMATTLPIVEDAAAISQIDIVVRGATPGQAQALKQLILHALLERKILATTDNGFIFDKSPDFWRRVEALHTRGRITVLDEPKP